jgi:hypothetical protein
MPPLLDGGWDKALWRQCSANCHCCPKSLNDPLNSPLGLGSASVGCAQQPSVLSEANPQSALLRRASWPVVTNYGCEVLI